MPIHPYFVHFPIAFFFLEAFLIFMAKWKQNTSYESFAYLVLKLAVGSMPFVMAAGYWDAGSIPPKLTRHFFAAVALFIVSCARFLLRRKHGPKIWEGAKGRLYRLLCGANLFLVVLTAHLGGLLVYG